MGMPQHGLAAPPLSPISVELALGKNGCSAVSRSGDQGRAEVSWAVDDLSHGRLLSLPMVSHVDMRA